MTFAGRLTDEQIVEHLARCRAVCFPPFEEDYGFVTAEAFASRKAVITCRDSGGPAELVQDGVNGVDLRADAGSVGGCASSRDGRSRDRRSAGGPRRLPRARNSIGATQCAQLTA